MRKAGEITPPSKEQRLRRNIQGAAARERKARRSLDYGSLRRLAETWEALDELERSRKCEDDARVMESQWLLTLAQDRLQQAKTMDLHTKLYWRTIGQGVALAEQAKAMRVREE